MVRRIWIFLVMAALLAVVGTTASADTIDLGTLNFDPFIADVPGFPGVNTFDVSNYTGDPNLGGNAFPPFFPVLTFVNFNDLSLSVTEDDGTLLPAIALGSMVGPGDTFFNAANFPDTQGFLSATLTGDLSTTTVTLSDGTVVTVGGDFSATIVPSMGTDLTAGVDYATISAETVVVGAPEPSGFVLLGCGALLMLALIRSRVPRLS